MTERPLGGTVKPGTRLYIPMTLNKWDQLELEVLGRPVRPADDGSMGVGFLTAFTNREDAERHFPDRPILTVEAGQVP